MKKLLILFILFNCSSILSQDKWLDFSKENEINYKITETKNTLKVNNLDFISVWDSKMTPNEKYGYLGGIKSLKIFHKGKQLNEFLNIPDNIGLDYIVFRFYDYNFDGFLDFTIQIDCGRSCYSDYYLYNIKKRKFIYRKDWSIRIQKINKQQKLILTQPDGMRDNRELFKVRNDSLIKLKRLQ